LLGDFRLRICDSGQYVGRGKLPKLAKLITPFQNWQRLNHSMPKISGGRIGAVIGGRRRRNFFAVHQMG